MFEKTTDSHRVKSSVSSRVYTGCGDRGWQLGVKGQRAVCFLRWSPGLKGRMWSSSSLKRGAGGVTESESRQTDVHSALSTISTLCVLCKASTLDSRTLHDASYSQL